MLGYPGLSEGHADPRNLSESGSPLPLTGASQPVHGATAHQGRFRTEAPAGRRGALGHSPLLIKSPPGTL